MHSMHVGLGRLKTVYIRGIILTKIRFNFEKRARTYAIIAANLRYRGGYHDTLRYKESFDRKSRYRL
jgi:hypothetical protein